MKYASSIPMYDGAEKHFGESCLKSLFWIDFQFNLCKFRLETFWVLHLGWMCPVTFGPNDLHISEVEIKDDIRYIWSEHMFHESRIYEVK